MSNPEVKRTNTHEFQAIWVPYRWTIWMYGHVFAIDSYLRYVGYGVVTGGGIKAKLIKGAAHRRRLEDPLKSRTVLLEQWSVISWAKGLRYKGVRLDARFAQSILCVSCEQNMLRERLVCDTLNAIGARLTLARQFVAVALRMNEQRGQHHSGRDSFCTCICILYLELKLLRIQRLERDDM